MSCYLVAPAHIRFLASWAEDKKVFSPNEDTPPTRKHIAESLAQANLDSVRARYPHHTDSTIEEDQAYKRECQGRVETHEAKPVEILKAVQALDYQSCEVKGWGETQAHQHLNWIQSRAISMLPGYDSAPWSIEVDRKPISVLISKI